MQKKKKKQKWLTDAYTGTELQRRQQAAEFHLSRSAEAASSSHPLPVSSFPRVPPAALGLSQQETNPLGNQPLWVVEHPWKVKNMSQHDCVGKTVSCL